MYGQEPLWSLPLEAGGRDAGQNGQDLVQV